MSRIRTKRLFDPERPVYARRQLTIGDRIFEVGDEVPWKDEALDVPLSMIQGWFRVRFIGHDRLEDGRPDDGVAQDAEPITDAQGRRLDGPTMEEWTAAGFPGERYPPEGYAERPSERLTLWRETFGPRLDDEQWTQVLRAREVEMALPFDTSDATPDAATSEPAAPETPVEAPATQAEPKPAPRTGRRRG